MHKRKTKPASSILKNISGNIIFEKDKLKSIWVDYIGELLHNDRPDKPTNKPNLEGKPILESKIKVALKNMKNNKAPGNDKITKEMLVACG